MPRRRIPDSALIARNLDKPEYKHLRLIIERAKDYGHVLTPVLNRRDKRLLNYTVQEGEKIHTVRRVRKVYRTLSGQRYARTNARLSQLVGSTALIIIDIGFEWPRFFIVPVPILREKYSSITTIERAQIHIPHDDPQFEAAAIVRILDFEDRWDYLD